MINRTYIIISSLPFACFLLGYIICNIFIGNQTYSTPKLVGLSLYEAVKLTSPHQVNIRVVSEKENNNILPGTILSQKPSSGRLIKTHQPILVTTTKAPPTITAPQLLEKDNDAIEKVCHDMGLKYKTYSLEYPAPRNSCIAQFPQATHIVHDKKMTIYLANDKPNMYLMPDLTNQPLSETIDLLKKYSNKISVFHGTQKVQSPYQNLTKVISQKPLAGSLIKLEQSFNVHLEAI